MGSLQGNRLNAADGARDLLLSCYCSQSVKFEIGTKGQAGIRHNKVASRVRYVLCKFLVCY